MTVESIVFAQIINCDEFVSELNKSERKPDVLALPSINIIAPLLSLTSSWIDTFRIFLDIKQSDDSHYTYTIERGGYTFSGDIYLSGFTVKNGSLTVHSNVTRTPTTSYLIIDEIHQLLARNIRSTRFIDAPMTPKYLCQLSNIRFIWYTSQSINSRMVSIYSIYVNTVKRVG